MAERQTLHVFHDGNFRLYGFTEDRSGGNLPTQLAPQGWKLLNTIEIHPGEGPRAGMDVEDIQAEIRKHGFCVKKDAISVRHFQVPAGHRA
jgi:hypothetical protein